MENSDEIEKKINKAKSQGCAPAKLRYEPGKRKCFNANEAVRSLDLALGGLKRSRLVDDQSSTNTTITNCRRNIRREPMRDMFMDVCPSSNFSQSYGNSSMMSMNFSQYELVRNLSSSNCNSDGAMSCTTSSTRKPFHTDPLMREEQLERFFRSAEMWTYKYNDTPPKLCNNKPM